MAGLRIRATFVHQLKRERDQPVPTRRGGLGVNGQRRATLLLMERSQGGRLTKWAAMVLTRTRGYGTELGAGTESYTYKPDKRDRCRPRWASPPIWLATPVLK